MKQRLSTFLKIAVTLVGLAAVFYQIDLEKIAVALAQTDLKWLFMGLVLVVISLVVRAYRWSLLLKGLGVAVPFGRLVELYFVGGFFTIALPSGFGGDVMRALEIAREVQPSVAAGTVILDRLTGLVMLFVMAAAMLPFRPFSTPPVLTWLILVGAVLGLVGLLVLVEGRLVRHVGRWLPAAVSPSGDNAIGRLLQAVQSCGWRAVAAASAVSVLFNLILAGWWYTNGLALGLDVPFHYYLIVMPVLSVPLLLPSIGGLGPPELIAPMLFAVVGVAGETAVSLSLLNFILQRVSGLMGAPVYLFTTLKKQAVT